MVYLGYNFDPGQINNIPNEEPTSVRESLSPERMTLVIKKNFLEAVVRDFIAIELNLFGKQSKLSMRMIQLVYQL
jgi:hypothetical protein